MQPAENIRVVVIVDPPPDPRHRVYRGDPDDDRQRSVDLLGQWLGVPVRTDHILADGEGRIDRRFTDGLRVFDAQRQRQLLAHRDAGQLAFGHGAIRQDHFDLLVVDQRGLERCDLVNVQLGQRVRRERSFDRLAVDPHLDDDLLVHHQAADARVVVDNRGGAVEHALVEDQRGDRARLGGVFLQLFDGEHPEQYRQQHERADHDGRAHLRPGVHLHQFLQHLVAGE